MPSGGPKEVRLDALIRCLVPGADLFTGMPKSASLRILPRRGAPSGDCAGLGYLDGEG